MKLLLRILFSAGLLIFGIIILGRSHAEAAPAWLLDTTSSKVGFIAKYSGIDVNGVFESYDAKIKFHPEDLSTSYIRIEIKTSSLNTESNDRDKVIKSGAFFDSSSFPTAIFEAKKFEKINNLEFIALGTLTLHGVTKKLALPFQASIDDSELTASGAAEVSRLEYGIGSGLWLDTAIIGEMVQITFAIKGQTN